MKTNRTIIINWEVTTRIKVKDWDSILITYNEDISTEKAGKYFN